MGDTPIVTLLTAFTWVGMLVALVAAVWTGRRYRQTRSTPIAFLTAGFCLAFLSPLISVVSDALFTTLFWPLTEESVTRSVPFSNGCLIASQGLGLASTVLLAIGVAMIVRHERQVESEPKECRR